MKKILYTLITLFMLSSCQDDVIIQEIPVVSEEGGQVTVTFGLEIPELQDASSRALGEFSFTEEYVESLPLQLVVFDEGGVLTEYKDSRNNDVEIIGIDATSSKLVNFKVTLSVTNSKRYIHFILNSPQKTYNWGTEGNLIGSLSVNGQTPAYWQRVEFPNGIEATLTRDENDVPVYTPTADLISRMTAIPMLRNFAKISVTASAAAAAKLTDISYYVVNVWDAGTVAPYYNGGFTDFVNFSAETDAKSKYVQITERGYEGIEPSEATLTQQGPKQADTEATWNVADGNWITANALGTTTVPGTPFYMYERRNTFVSLDVPSTFLIIRGKYNGSNDYSYYKLDLVYTADEETGQQQYYNILRNFHYAVNINSVMGYGYPSACEAAKHAASNNLSGSIDLRDLTNISDSESRLFVSYTDKTIVYDGSTISATAEVQYRYVKSSNTDTNTNANLILRELTEDDTDKRITGIYYKNGSGTNVYIYDDFDDDGDCEWADSYAGNTGIAIVNDWSTIYVEFSGAAWSSVLTNTLGFYISGLSREVDYHLRTIMPMIVECRPYKVLEGVKQSVAANILIPAGITGPDDSYQLFPLEFWVEAEQLTISPDVVSNKAAITLSPYEMPVESGSSIIASKAGKQTFRYKRTITNEEYQQLPTKTVTVNKELDGTTDLTSPIIETYKVIPCHFLTNTTTSASKVYAENGYFNLIKYGEFINGTPDISNATLTDTGIYGTGETATLTFTAVTAGTYTITSDNLSEASRSVSLTTDSLAANTEKTISLVTSTWEKTSMVTITAPDGTEYDVMAEARKTLPMKATTKFVLNGKESDLTGNPTLYVYTDKNSALSLADNKVAEVTNTDLTSTNGTSKVIEGLKESTVLWFAYQNGDYVYVDSTTAGALEAGNTELIFSDENRAELPLIMSAELTGEQYYGVGKTVTLTLTTNKPGTYTVAFAEEGTNGGTATITIAEGSTTGTATYTTLSWSGKISATVTPQSPLTGNSLLVPGDDRNVLKIIASIADNNSEAENYITNDDNSDTTIIIKSQNSNNGTTYGTITAEELSNNTAEITYAGLASSDELYFRFNFSTGWGKDKKNYVGYAQISASNATSSSGSLTFNQQEQK